LLRIAAATAAVLLAGAVLARRAGERRAPPTPPTARPIRVLPPETVIAGPVEWQGRVGAWELRVVRDTASADRVAEVRHSSRRALAVRAFDVRFDRIGDDLTGDSVPDVVLVQFSGVSPHCCTLATVLGLGDTLALYGSVDGADGDVEFEDLDGDGASEARVGDFRFAYWRDYAFAETAVPDVVLRRRGDAWVPACDLMRAEAPDDRTLRRRAAELGAGWIAGDPPAPLYGYALDLIYQGNADAAWRFLDLAWPPRLPGKRDFLRDLRDRLAGSPCWGPPPPARPIT
jgi:hypothetical protein